VEVPNLSSAQRRGMLALLQTAYANVSATQFNHDLDEKEWAVLGSDPASGVIWGFSTMRRLRTTINGEAITAFYSGDTASRADKRGAATSAGTRLAIRKMFYEMMISSAHERSYWFMISSTYKSYRLLPMIFRDFAPGPGRRLSREEIQIISELSRIKRLDFDRSSGIVRFGSPTLPREVEGEVETRREPDAYARFFHQANTGAPQGDRLAALTEVSMSNLTPLGARIVAPTNDLAPQPAAQLGGE
jgi:hypothetical protein